jgi:diaminopimelate decarboxylase
VLAGPLCFAGDILLHETDLSNINAGSQILIADVGAYTFSLSNSFNGRTAFPWALYKNGDLMKTTEAEQNFNRLFLQHHSKFDLEDNTPQFIDSTQVNLLQSNYLWKDIKLDEYEMTEAVCISPQKYRFKIRIKSPVDFISMPTAIRLIGDAAIVSVLHSMNQTEKSISVWGQKIDLEYLDFFSSSEDFECHIDLTHSFGSVKKKQAISFYTPCRKLYGTIILSF